jgi:hypothetical protein
MHHETGQFGSIEPVTSTLAPQKCNIGITKRRSAS